MQGGDERVLATLYDRHAAALLGFVLRIVREHADAEAVLMATFLQAWRSASSFDGSRGSVLAWLARSVRGVTAVLVSVEPLGGSVQPTSAPFLAGTFPGA